jgi:hypothetical protein
MIENINQVLSLADDAMRQLEAGDSSGALSNLLNLYFVHPDIDFVNYRLALALEASGNLSRALRFYRRAIELNPGSGVCHHGYMRALAKTGYPDLAISAYGGNEGIARLAPDLRLCLAEQLFRSGADPVEFADSTPNLLSEKVAFAPVRAEADVFAGCVLIERKAGQVVVRAPRSLTANPILTERLIGTMGYLDRLAGTPGPDGAVHLFLDDIPRETDTAMLCPSGHLPNHLLVPDGIFLSSNAYSHLKERSLGVSIAWDERLPLAYWRGALTGAARSVEEIKELPRVRLCRLSRRHPELLDARITNIFQYGNLADRFLPGFEQEGLVGPHEDQMANFRYRYMIDIDGNSNAWSGFFLKLLSGSPTIKLMSPYRQWFYDRLEPGVHYIPIHDLEELPGAIEWLKANDAGAREMGDRARRFALDMTLDSEFPAFAAAFDRVAGPAWR